MRKLAKKIMIYSMVGMMQIGLGTAVVAASPRGDWHQQHNDRQWQENYRHGEEMKQRGGEDHRHWNDRMWRENQQHERWARQDNERQYRNELEMQRHEREMERRQEENDQAWNDRLYLENQYHEQSVNQIEADLIVMFMNR
jgi:hypothetical protein